MDPDVMAFSLEAVLFRRGAARALRRRFYGSGLAIREGRTRLVRYTRRMTWLDDVKWDRDGLVPVIAQERGTGDVLMFAWMNREALARTAETGRAVYWSRSRQKLWAARNRATCSRCTSCGSTATTTSCCWR
jgi:hypothetical protein